MPKKTLKLDIWEYAREVSKFLRGHRRVVKYFSVVYTCWNSGESVEYTGNLIGSIEA